MHPVFRGGNDIAGPEFFSFVNHAASHLANQNAEVLHGVVGATFEKAYEDVIDVLQAEAQTRKHKTTGLCAWLRLSVA